MPTPDELKGLQEPLRALQQALDHLENKGVIIGGLAASLLGKTRMTSDLDALLIASIDQIPTILDVFRAEGIFPRINDALTFARRNRVLLLRYAKTETDIDISLGFLPFEHEVIERSIEVDIEGFLVRLPTVEDLIIMKAVANRLKDLVDIQALVDAHPTLDRNRIFGWVEQFAEILGSTKILDDLRKILNNDQL